MMPRGDFLRAAAGLAAAISAMIMGGGCAQPERAHEQMTAAVDARDAFFENLRRLCGQRYQGSAEFTTPANQEMADAMLVMHVASCEQDQIRIPFHVDEDRSRTWILTRRDGGLLFKHDHRHEDGTPDDITNYGGWATAEGTEHLQRFPADEETAALIPEAATNVWTLELDPDRGRFIYDLQRHQEPRFRAMFDLRHPPGER
jgi:hypothetical protein